MAHGKIAALRWGAFDNYEDYGSSASLQALWTKPFDPGAIGAHTLGTSQKYDGRRSLELYILNSTGATQEVRIQRTFTGLLPSTTYSIEVRFRKSAAVGTAVLWSNGEINMADPGVNTWGLSGVLTAASDASGNLMVRFDVRGVLATQTVTYWFDEVRIWRTHSLGWPLDAPTNYSRPKPGYKRVRNRYGIEDVWDEGHDQLVRVRARWIPPLNATGPTATGFNEVGGFRQFLEYANGGRVLQFVPDTLLSTYYNVVLVDPILEAPELEPDVTRTYSLLLRSIDDTPIAVY